MMNLYYTMTSTMVRNNVVNVPVRVEWNAQEWDVQSLSAISHQPSAVKGLACPVTEAGEVRSEDGEAYCSTTTRSPWSRKTPSRLISRRPRTG